MMQQTKYDSTSVVNPAVVLSIVSANASPAGKIILKTKDGQGIPFLGSCDAILNIESLEFHPVNPSLRIDSDTYIEEQKKGLKESIVKNGLREAITMYTNSNTISGGHTRTTLLKELGCTEVPVKWLPRTPDMIEKFGEYGEIDPWYEDVLNEHAVSNKYIQASIFGRYLAVRMIMEYTVDDFDADKAAKGQTTSKIIKSILDQRDISLANFDYIEGVRFGFNKEFSVVDKDTGKASKKKLFVPGREDLYSDLGNPEKDYTPSKLCKLQTQDFENTLGVSYPQTPEMDSIMESLDMRKVIEGVDKALVKFFALGQQSELGNWVNKSDDNYISFTVHNMVCTFACSVLNDQLKGTNGTAEAKQTEKQGHYDILIKDSNGKIINSIEVKATFGNKEWYSQTKKNGYALLIAYNKERTDYFAASAYLDSSNWTGGVAGKYRLTTKEVFDNKNAKYYVGKIAIDNDVCRIQKQSISSFS